jgi:hypothetical protein
MRSTGKIPRPMITQINASIRARLAFASLAKLADSVQVAVVSAHLHALGEPAPRSHIVDEHSRKHFRSITNVDPMNSKARHGMRKLQTFGSFSALAKEGRKVSPEERSSDRTFKKEPTLDLSKLLWLFR